MGRIRRLFKGTLPMFSALWLGMMLVLLWLNSEGQSARMGASMQSYRWSVEYQYSEIWNGSAAEKKKPVILTWRLMEEPLYSIGGITQTRVSLTSLFPDNRLLNFWVSPHARSHA